MKRYDPKAKCPKCGAELIETHHCAGVCPAAQDVMVRKCELCGYKWKEEPLDAATEGGAA